MLDIVNYDKINARQLYSELGVARDFPTWIVSKIATVSLKEGIDYDKMAGCSKGAGRPLIEYILTLEAAKEILLTVRPNEKVVELIKYIDTKIIENIVEGRSGSITIKEPMELFSAEVATIGKVTANNSMTTEETLIDTTDMNASIVEVKNHSIFNSEFGDLRTVNIDGKTYIVAKDAAKILGYANPTKAVTKHCPNRILASVNTNGGYQTVNLIDKPDLYRLVTSSRLQNARKFEKWVYEEVLLDVEEKGFYASADALEKLLSDPNSAIQILTKYRDEKAEKEKLAQELKVVTPKVCAYNDFLDSSDVYPIGVAAKILCIPRAYGSNKIIGKNTLYAWMRRDGILGTKNDEKNIPYQKYVSQGYFEIKALEDENRQLVRVTAKGLDWLYKKYKYNNMPKSRDEHFNMISSRDDIEFEEVEFCSI